MLIAPLDWGLGHTTRCIPIIKEFKKRQINVVVACNQGQNSFLKREFPDLKTVFLPGYDISYSFNKVGTTFKIFLQSAKILTAIKQEYRRLGQILHAVPADLVISDNRYGFHHPTVYSVILTHQLSIRTGLGNLSDSILRNKLAAYMNEFDETWIPDNAAAPILAGALSRPYKKDGKQFYIGPVSRLQACNQSTQKHILIVLSGPEPQRSILEKAILNSYLSISEDVILVRGSDAPIIAELPAGLVVYDFAETTLLNDLMCNASVIISRSGYTSVMDILKLKKRWIAIPTPGQAEQEYLAVYLHQNRWAMAVDQSRFHLSTALKDAASFMFELPVINTEKYKETIDRILCF